MDELKPAVYKNKEWRIFIDSSIRSFKGVLLHNTNDFAPIPLARSIVLKKTHKNLEFLLKNIK